MAVPVVVVTVPARCPRVGAVFQGIVGTVAGDEKTGGNTVSYSDGWVSARVSSARLASVERDGPQNGATERQSGDRYEYPIQPIALLPFAFGVRALRTWITLFSTRLR